MKYITLKKKNKKEILKRKKKETFKYEHIVGEINENQELIR